jgi:hypothetical protein
MVFKKRVRPWFLSFAIVAAIVRWSLEGLARWLVNYNKFYHDKFYPAPVRERVEDDGAPSAQLKFCSRSPDGLRADLLFLSHLKFIILCWWLSIDRWTFLKKKWFLQITRCTGLWLTNQESGILICIFFQRQWIAKKRWLQITMCMGLWLVKLSRNRVFWYVCSFYANEKVIKSCIHFVRRSKA